jgi:hypothetical protein
LCFLLSCGEHVVAGSTCRADGVQLVFANGLRRQPQCRLLGSQYVGLTLSPGLWFFID